MCVCVCVCVCVCARVRTRPSTGQHKWPQASVSLTDPVYMNVLGIKQTLAYSGLKATVQSDFTIILVEITNFDHCMSGTIIN